MKVLLDDHLLRDLLAGADPALTEAIGGGAVATTNLWYARLCKSAATSTGGALVGRWSAEDRMALAASLFALPDSIDVVPLRSLAWEMGRLTAVHKGLSTLGAEAVAAAVALDARVLVSSRDDGPGIRACCRSLGIRYDALDR